METVTIRIPEPVLVVLTRLAREHDVSLGQIIRQSLDREIRRCAKAKTPNRADERLVAPLRALLADDFAYSESWSELLRRFATKGFQLREAGGGLILVEMPSGARVCKGSELGYSYAQLMRKFHQPFPGHKHRRAYLSSLLPSA